MQTARPLFHEYYHCTIWLCYWRSVLQKKEKKNKRIAQVYERTRKTQTSVILVLRCV